jgi:hypothetical protein
MVVLGAWGSHEFPASLNGSGAFHVAPFGRASGLHRDLGRLLGVGRRSRKSTEADLPQGNAPAAVSLCSIRDPKHVNALLPSQGLDLGGVGLTVVYGDNASGKSGYARLIKSAVRSLHHEDVNENVFEARSGAQHAEFNYREGNEGLRTPVPTVGAVAARRVDRVMRSRQGLGRFAGGHQRERNRALPDVPEGTPSESFLESISGKTTKSELDKACDPPDDAEAELDGLRSRTLPAAFGVGEFTSQATATSL